jgi:spermidine synthase
MIKGRLLIEEVSRDTIMIFTIERIIINTRTKYQEVQILDLQGYGRTLVLDGYIQSTELDEYIYHESLVHPALTTHPEPKNILIIGGSEGATLREVLKHNTVKDVVMVDIDGELINYTKKYLGVMHRGSFNDDRLTLIIEDGYKYIENEKRKYDIIILDLTDPYSSDIAKKLYSREFYTKIKNILKRDGIIVTQAGNSFYYPREYKYVKKNIMETFQYTYEYWTWIPSFGYPCNYIIASDKIDPTNINEEIIDRILNDRGVKNKLYDGEYHTGLFKNKIIIGNTRIP